MPAIVESYEGYEGSDGTPIIRLTTAGKKQLNLVNTLELHQYVNERIQKELASAIGQIELRTISDDPDDGRTQIIIPLKPECLRKQRDVAAYVAMLAEGLSAFSKQSGFTIQLGQDGDSFTLTCRSAADNSPANRSFITVFQAHIARMAPAAARNF